MLTESYYIIFPVLPGLVIMSAYPPYDNNYPAYPPRCRSGRCFPGYPPWGQGDYPPQWDPMNPPPAAIPGGQPPPWGNAMGQQPPWGGPMGQLPPWGPPPHWGRMRRPPRGSSNGPPPPGGPMGPPPQWRPMRQPPEEDSYDYGVQPASMSRTTREDDADQPREERQKSRKRNGGSKSKK